jgi:hypothetical protein
LLSACYEEGEAYNRDLRVYNRTTDRIDVYYYTAIGGEHHEVETEIEYWDSAAIRISGDYIDVLYLNRWWRTYDVVGLDEIHIFEEDF